MSDKPKVSTSKITPEAEASAGGSTKKKMPDKLRILSIDGGGVRGIIPATILEYLEKELQDKDGRHRRLADYFDLIVGTSTGGLIAAMITTKRPSNNLARSAAEVLQFYRKYASTIFPPPR
jgi:patatin-like phospholipase/acyl hydrolase